MSGRKSSRARRVHRVSNKEGPLDNNQMYYICPECTIAGVRTDITDQLLNDPQVVKMSEDRGGGFMAKGDIAMKYMRILRREAIRDMKENETD